MYLLLAIFIIWPLDTTSHHQNVLSDEEMLTIMQSYPELTGSFIKGAKVCVNTNISPEKGIANGTQVIITLFLLVLNYKILLLLLLL